MRNLLYLMGTGFLLTGPTPATLFGGQGTINVPSWSADSKRLAFVRYRWVAPGM
ncbi:MAG TPA: hypothetical protein PKI62_14335 [bacterium]|nr:hypothetical protein [bacterium]HPR89420.1 hypothetical protein [bacterium]